MNGSLQAVFLTLLAYLVYVLIPMIPAVVIYRLFPKTRVSAKGVLSGLTINTGGAFAAYLIVVLLGKPLIDNTTRHIGALGTSVWTVKIPLLLMDGDREVLHREDAWNSLEHMKISLRPSIHRVGGEVELRLPVSGHMEPDNIIKLDVPGFGSSVVDLAAYRRDLGRQNQVEWNPARRTIVFKKPLEIHYNDASPYMNDGMAQPVTFN